MVDAPIRIADVIRTIEEQYPLAYQESYDNSGLQVGDAMQPLTGVMLSVETTEAVLRECYEKGCNLLISHHPILFRGLKSISTRTYQERCVAYALKHDIVIYAAHTSADNELSQGVNHYLADLIGLKEEGRRPLIPQTDILYKLQVYVPRSGAGCLRGAMEHAGAGAIGAYTGCTFSTDGTGRFRPGEESNPTIGEHGQMTEVDEEMISTIVPKHLVSEVLDSVLRFHPYETPAYDLIPMELPHQTVGMGLVGELYESIEPQQLLDRLSQIPSVERIAHSAMPTHPIKRVALCGGSGGGSDSIKHAIRSGADVYITGEAKYNDYLDIREHSWLVTLGHFESEAHIPQMIKALLSQKYSTFAVHLSHTDTNPVHYYL